MYLNKEKKFFFVRFRLNNRVPGSFGLFVYLIVFLSKFFAPSGFCLLNFCVVVVVVVVVVRAPGRVPEILGIAFRTKTFHSIYLFVCMCSREG